MTKKLNIREVAHPQQYSYVDYSSGTKKDRDMAMKALSSAVDEYSGKVYASSRMRFSPQDAGGSGLSGRYPMTHSDYEAWRPDESTRNLSQQQKIIMAEQYYKDHGIIKNVIDLMGDFASQGIRLVHPNKSVEKFYQAWFRKVNGCERSERFLSNLYKLGNVVVRTRTARLSKKGQQRLMKARAQQDIIPVEKKLSKREIPFKYTFLHPSTIHVIGGQFASLISNPQYAVVIPRPLARIINNPRTQQEKETIAALPQEILDAARSGKPITLDPNKTSVYHYKKDDWQTWADPIVSSMAIDISLYEKLKLADRAALDGAISNIRIFKLGSLENKIVPDAGAMAKLAEILESNVQAGTLDLVWGPDIELIESNTNVHNFLGADKYEPTLMALYSGLGIPPTLTGTFGNSGTTNNYISLKTLIQRLEYGRTLLVKFWDEQIKLVQESLGFSKPARVEFDLMNLGDEVAEKALLVQLSDRNLISDELLQRYFGTDPEMEKIRLNAEKKERAKGKKVEKAGPFYDPQVNEALKKIFVQSGILTPSEVGVELLPKKRGEKNPLQAKTPPQEKNKGVPGQGRPMNSKDTKKRKQKDFKPKIKASEAELMMWAYSAQDQIEHVINPFILDKFNKKNMRSLSAQQTHDSEMVKFGVLYNVDPLVDINEDTVFRAITRGFSDELVNIYEDLIQKAESTLKRPLNKDEKKTLKAQLYVASMENNNG